MSARMINVVLVGAGRAGKVHAKSLTQYLPNARAVGVVDSTTETLHATANEFGIEARHTSLEEAIGKLQFDAVVITTPTFTHKDLAVQAAQAGKHVFVEKPMALSLAECDAMIAAANDNGVILQLGFMRRFSPEFVSAYERIQAGEIGTPTLVKSLTHGPGLPPPWARDLETSNGMLAEVNSHDWDCVRWLMGSNPSRVYAEVANIKGASRDVHTPHFYDTAIVNVRFENGGLGSISGVCPCDYGYDARVEIIGEKGIMQIGEMQGQPIVVCTNRDTGLITPIFRTWPQRFEWAYIREMEHFVSCITNGTPPKVGGEDGRWAVASVLAGTKSFLEERPVKLSEIMEAQTA
jgi:myo-inositol 2-dehydrogenase/D-chiro-inositol 1-dehydrogenase/scyllo-inositol 2-dehydrogenase (NAD+)